MKEEIARAHPCSPMVGRAHEIGVLREQLAAVERGDGRCVLLAGDAGIGKTRLAQELAREAERRGARVYWGHCCEGEGAPPYWPWKQILDSLTHDDHDSDVPAWIGARAAELSVLEPHTYREGLQPSAVNPPDDRFVLCYTVCSLVKQLAMRSATLLIIDDLHCADPESMMLVRYLGLRLSGMRVMLIGLYRDAELRERPDLSRSCGELARCSRTILLGALPAGQVERYVRSVLGSAAPEPLVHEICERSEGNPLYLREFLYLAAAGWENLPSIPTGVREMLALRLSRCSYRVRRLLAIGAVIGREFDLRSVEVVLRSLTGPQDGAVGLSELLESIGEAETAGLVAAPSRSNSGYRFCHVLFRDFLYDELPIAERVRLHEAVASSVQGRAAHSDAKLAELAHHSLQVAFLGGDAANAVIYCRQAAERFAGVLAYEDAARHYRNALRVSALHGEDLLLECDLRVGLAQALWRGGGAHEAKPILFDAAALARRVGDPAKLAEVALSFGTALVGVTAGKVDWRLVALLEEAAGAVGGCAPGLTSRLLGRLAEELYYTPELDRRVRLSCEAVAIARRLEDPRTLLDVLISHRFASAGPDNLDERLQVTREIIDLAEKMHLRELAAYGHVWHLTDVLEQGEMSAVDRELRICERLALELGFPWLRWQVDMTRAMRAFLAGRFDEAERLALRASSIAEETENPDGRHFLAIQLLALRREQSRLEEIEASTGFAAEENASIPAWGAAVIDLLCKLGRPEARDLFEAAAANEFEGIPRDINRLIALTLLAETCASLGDSRRAAVLYRLLEPYGTRNVTIEPGVVAFGPAARQLGLLASLLERWDEARMHFEQAIRINARLGYRPFLAHTQREYAEMLLRYGQGQDQSLARSLLDQAAAAYESMGMQAYYERAEAARSKLSTLSEAHAPSVIPHPSSLIRGQPSSPVPDSASLQTRPNVLRRCDGYWDVMFNGVPARLRDSKGMRDVYWLIRNSGEPVHVIDLLAASGDTLAPNVVSDFTGACAIQEGLTIRSVTDFVETRQPQVDRVFLSERLRTLHEERARAERNHDSAEIARIDRDLEDLLAVYHLTDEPRSRGHHHAVEKSRKKVHKRIKEAIANVERWVPELGRHLRDSIKTGTTCCYRPSGTVKWEL